MSPLLKMQKNKGILRGIFRGPKMAAGELAYFFVATECKPPPTTDDGHQYLAAMFHLALQGQNSEVLGKRGKLAVAFDSPAKDRVDLIGWASQAFGLEPKTMVTDFFLFFGRLEHATGNGTFLIARRPA